MPKPPPPTGPWIQLFSGHAFNPLDPQIGTFTLEDIAHGCALEPRYSGQSKVPYSVAEHQYRGSVIMETVIRATPGRSLLDSYLGSYIFLFHDAHEGLGWRDIARPIKHTPEFRFYREGADRCQEVIWKFLRVTVPTWAPPLVHWVDNLILSTERDIMGPSPHPWAPLPPPLVEIVRPWSWSKAERKFLARAKELECLIRRTRPDTPGCGPGEEIPPVMDLPPVR